MEKCYNCEACKACNDTDCGIVAEILPSWRQGKYQFFLDNDAVDWWIARNNTLEARIIKRLGNGKTATLCNLPPVKIDGREKARLRSIWYNRRPLDTFDGEKVKQLLKERVSDTATTEEPDRKYLPLRVWRSERLSALLEHKGYRDVVDRHDVGMKRKYRTVHAVRVSPAVKPDSITEAGEAYLYQCAEKMTYTAIRSVYCVSHSPYLFGLLQAANAHNERKRLDDVRKRIDYGKQDETDNGEDFTYYNRYDTSPYRPFEPMQRDNWKKRKIGSPAVLEFTEKGKSLMEVPFTSMSDYEDCLQIAFLALWEFAARGFITDYESVWNHAGYAYRAVNKYICSRRKELSELKRFVDYCVWIDPETGNETYTDAFSTPDIFTEIFTEICKDIVEHTIVDNAGRALEENVKAVYRGLVDEKTEQMIADESGIARQHISRYKSYIKEIGHKTGVYDTIREILYS